MFCPNCGTADQQPDTYCRNCGNFLPDFSGNKKKKATPEDQFRVSLLFNIMSAIAALSMAIMLYVFHLGKPDTHPSVYMAAALLVAISSWQIASFFNNRQLKNRFVRKTENEAAETDAENVKEFQSAKENYQLQEADLSDMIPPSIVENTTKKLKVKIKK